MVKERACPICRGDYYAINQSNHVCKRHSSWVVTICSHCGKASMSYSSGICPMCDMDEINSRLPRTRLSRDRQTLLLHYGLD